MPLVSVVLPLPRSPERRIMSGAFTRLANSLPQAMVSSAEWVSSSSRTEGNLLQQFVAGQRDRRRNCAGELAGRIFPIGSLCGRRTVQVSAERKNTQPISCAELRSKRGEHASEDISRAAFGEFGAAGSVHEDAAIRGGENCVKSFQQDVRVGAFGSFRCDLQ